MHWIEAVTKSPVDTATMTYSHGFTTKIFYKTKDDCFVVVKRRKGTIYEINRRDAQPEEYEGFIMWEPVYCYEKSPLSIQLSDSLFRIE